MKSLGYSKNSKVSAQLSEDHNPQWFYFIDGVFHQQKGYNSEEKALKAGKAKLAEYL